MFNYRMSTNYIIIIFLFLNTSCITESNDYFPLSNGKVWNYNVTINPGVEEKVVYKKTNVTLKKVDIIDNKKNKISAYPILREDNSVYYYSKGPEGIYREGSQLTGNQSIVFESDKKYVLKFPIEIGTRWNSNSKTYLILRRYAYFDYRATTNFELKYKIVSINESVIVPAGKFKNCVKISGIGETTFIGNNEIGAIKIIVKTTDWYAPKIGLIKSVRSEETDTDLFGTSRMVQVLDDFK